MDDSGHTPVWTGQRIERTNARGRHRYVPAFKAWIVEQALIPGTSLAGLAMRHQVNANQLRRWVMLRQRLGSAPAPAPKLLPVMVAAPPVRSSESSGNAVEIDVAGVVVKVRSGVDPATLRTVIMVLRGMPT
tara:strand:+ start:905 stop:1300 length:396 start_codon:yes stop_codon:yes gene_type:complete